MRLTKRLAVAAATAGLLLTAGGFTASAFGAGGSAPAAAQPPVRVAAGNNTPSLCVALLPSLPGLCAFV
jgi:hypothetical protein